MFSENKAGLNLSDSQIGNRESIRRYLESGGSQNTSRTQQWGLQLCLELGVLKDIAHEGRVVISEFSFFGVTYFCLSAAGQSSLGYKGFPHHGTRSRPFWTRKIHRSLHQ